MMASRAKLSWLHSDMDTPGGVSGANTAAIIVASGGLVATVAGLFGKAIAWLFRQRRSRLNELEHRLDRIQSECAAERLESTRKIDCLVGVCIVLIDGGVHANVRAKHMLGAEFPDLLRRVYPAEDFMKIAPDMQDLATRAGEALAKPRRTRRTR